MSRYPELDRIIDVYGGLALWRQLKHVRVRMDALGGPLPVLKGLRRTFAMPGMVTIFPHEWRVEFHDYPRAGERAIFEAGTVELSDAAGAVSFRQAGYRDEFRGLRKHRRWSNADAVYFFGYALATYCSVPFILSEYATGVTTGRDGVWVSARFPETMDTHSADQRFWFDREGLLARHDYRADIVGVWATGAHFTSGYRCMAGLPIASRREVYARIAGLVTPIPVLTASISALEVVLGPA